MEYTRWNERTQIQEIAVINRYGNVHFKDSGDHIPMQNVENAEAALRMAGWKKV